MDDNGILSVPEIALLSCRDVFASLTSSEQIYAHHLARAAWLGTRIILRQVSPESTPIFDFILELHEICAGKWDQLSQLTGVSEQGIGRFLEYAATFLQNIGNYYGHGDQKFLPNVSEAGLQLLSNASSKAKELHSQFARQIFSGEQKTLGYTTSHSQTNYYLGEPLSAQEIDEVTNIAQKCDIQAENTRIRKVEENGRITYEVLIASVNDKVLLSSDHDQINGHVKLLWGDHSKELEMICDSLSRAREFAGSSKQSQYLALLIDSLKGGDMNKYRESQKLWVEDQQPAVETIFGFVEPYRDPHGIRAEYEGLVGLAHKQETELLEKLVHGASEFIPDLPWVTRASPSPGNGPFEGDGVGHRDFSSLHTLAYCSTLIFPGINLPNYNDIRQDFGFKNVMISNRIDGSPMAGDTKAAYIPKKDAQNFLLYRKQTYYLWVVFHELFGHGTGKFLAETEQGIYNFDRTQPPINPVTGKPIESWYKPEQTYTGAFGDIATSVDECRAECVGAILLSNPQLMALCGITKSTTPSLDDLEYNMYLQLGIAGLRSLENYEPITKQWGQAHSQGHFAMFRAILEEGDGFMTVNHDAETDTLEIAIVPSKIRNHGKRVLEDLALHLHVFRCTADVEACREYYGRLTNVDEKHLLWRDIALRQKPPQRLFVQPNTFLDGDRVTMKEYDTTCEGMIESWYERSV